jgi:hypothetical protein
MLNQSDFSVVTAIEMFAEFGVDAGYLVPTTTGLEKSILDAHQQLRSFFLENAVHDYSDQDQGQSGKRKINVHLLSADGSDTREMSLYRPDTKKGDPRVWISHLGKYANAGNLLAFIVDGRGEVFVVNCSKSELVASRHEIGSPLNRLLTVQQQHSSASELLEMLKGVSRKGFVDSMRSGDTGVGFTLESMLGIAANSSRSPDYKGIEIKASRTKRSGRSVTKQTLFSQVPDWKLSSCSSGAEILREFGYPDVETGRTQLYTTVSSSPNPSGLFLAVDEDADLVESLAQRETHLPIKVVQWTLESLKSALAAKHNETFWVSAQKRVGESGVEQFHYVKVRHTRAPLVNNFSALVNSGVITMDFTLSTRPTGATRDHGYLFRIDRRNHHLMFPNPIEYDLTAS